MKKCITSNAGLTSCSTVSSIANVGYCTSGNYNTSSTYAATGNWSTCSNYCGGGTQYRNAIKTDTYTSKYNNLSCGSGSSTVSNYYSQTCGGKKVSSTGSCVATCPTACGTAASTKTGTQSLTYVSTIDGTTSCGTGSQSCSKSCAATAACVTTVTSSVKTSTLCECVTPNSYYLMRVDNGSCTGAKVSASTINLSGKTKISVKATFWTTSSSNVSYCVLGLDSNTNDAVTNSFKSLSFSNLSGKKYNLDATYTIPTASRKSGMYFKISCYHTLAGAVTYAKVSSVTVQ